MNQPIKPKYRILNLKELEALKSDFISFLALNGIDADTWKLMQQDDFKRNQTIVLFSDSVLESVFQKVKFVNFRNQKKWISISCKKDKMELLGIEAKSANTNLLYDESFIKDGVLLKEKLNFISGKKNYQKSREYEIFEMTEQGEKLDKGEFFNQLKLWVLEK